MLRRPFALNCLLVLILLVVSLPLPAAAFWGFGSGRSAQESGLDLVEGYDLNTVVTVSGRVEVGPDPEASPVTVTVTAGSEALVVVLGPRWYLQHDDLDWPAGSAVTVRGSKAQGRDGLTYLLAERVDLPGVGQLVLRSDTGRPAWSGGGPRGGSRDAGQGIMRGGSGGRHGR